jgi:hypothetical protein
MERQARRSRSPIPTRGMSWSDGMLGGHWANINDLLFPTLAPSPPRPATCR